MACNEAITALNDCICVVRNCIIDDRILVGGGSVEIELHRKILEKVVHISGVEQ